MKCDLIKKYMVLLIKGLALTLFFSATSYAQTKSDKFCSNLPIVVATFTGENKSFPPVSMDSPESRLASKAKRTMLLKVFDQNPTDTPNGKINCITDDSGKVEATMHYRGSSSLGFPKHQFGVKLTTPWNLKSNPALKTENFLGMPYGGKSWIFSAEQANLDGTYLRNTLSFHLQNEFGKLMSAPKAWAPRTRFFELFIEQDYIGLYTVAEAIEFGEHRVDISRVGKDKNPPGLLYKIDQPSPKECDISITDLVTNEKFVVYDYRGIKPITQGNDQCNQKLPDFWSNAFSLWSQALKSLQPTKETLKMKGRDYATLIETDDDSFAVSFLLNEFIKDPDGYNRNTFFYQLFTGDPKKLIMYAGPLWDKNLGYDLHLSPSDFPITGGYMPPGDSIYRGASGWTFGVKFNFWKDVFKRPAVQEKICSYWDKATKNSILTEGAINNFLKKKMDWINTSVQGSTPVERDCERYFPNTQCASQYKAKTALLTKYVQERLIWMSAQLGKTENECRSNIKAILEAS